MKIIYGINQNWTEEDALWLKKYDIDIVVGKTNYIEVEESIFLQIQHLFNDRALIGISTKFDKKEYENAKWLTIKGLWGSMYPEPSGNGKFLEASYNLDKHCNKCGLGKIQKAPFKLKTNPKWGKHKIMSLHWEHDKIFAETRFYNDILKNMGIKSIPVLIGKNNKVSETVVQLEIPITKKELDVKDQPFQICNTCKRKKYMPDNKGFSFEYKQFPEALIFYTSEFFGPGGVLANRNVYISQELKKIIQKWDTSVKDYNFNICGENAGNLWELSKNTAFERSFGTLLT